MEITKYNKGGIDWGKTELKGIDQYMYMKSKNRLNSLYGMMVTNILQDITEYIDNEKVFNG